jgi:hypothetical protein
MSALGSLVVKLALEYAQYTQGLNKSEQETLAHAKRVQDAFDGIQNKVNSVARNVGATLVAGLGAAAFASIIGNAVRSGEALHDLSIQTGATVEALSGLASVGKTTGTGVDQIANNMTRLARNLAGAREEGKGTGKAIQALGIDLQTFKQLKPEEQMLTLAQSMEKFADGNGKAAAAQALFGKEGAKNLPFMKDLAQVGELQAKVTTEQANAADNFSDNLIKTRASSEAWKKELALGMVPALNEGLQAFLDITNSTGGLRDGVRQLSRDGSIADWTRNTITGVSYVIDGFVGVKRVVQSVGEYIGAAVASSVSMFSSFGEAYDRVRHFDFSGATAAVRNGVAQQKTIWSSLGSTLDDIWGETTLGAKLRARMVDLKGMSSVAAQARDQLKFDNVDEKPGAGGGVSEAEKQHNAYIDLVAAIQEKIDVNKRETETGRVLTEAEKQALEIRKLVSKETIGEADASSDRTKALLLELDTTDKASIAAKAFTKSLADNAAAYSKLLDQADQDVDKLRDQIREQKDHNASLHLGKDAVAELAAAKLEETAASKERLAILAQDIDWSGQLSERYRTQAKELRDLAGLKRTGGAQERAIEDFKATWNSVDKTAHDVFTNIFEGGKTAFTKLRDTLKSTLLDLLYQMTVRKWIFDITANVTGQSGGVMGAVANASGMGNSMLGGSGLVGSVMNGYSLGAGAGGAYASSVGAGLATDAMGATVLEGAAAAGIETGMAGAVTAGLAAIPVAGWIALAGMAIFSMSGSKGGPKDEGGYSPNSLNIQGRDVGGNLQGSQRGDVAGAKQYSDTISAAYAALANTFDLAKKTIDVGVFWAKDPKGTSQTQLQVTSSAGYDRGARMGGIENVGRDDASFQTAVTAEVSHVLLDALQKADLAQPYKDILNAVSADAGVEQIQAAIKRVSDARTQQAQLEETIYQATATEEQKLQRAREKERAAVDPLNAALLEQVYAQQDVQKATAAATAALAQKAENEKKVADERAGLERQIMDLTGDTAGLRKLELDALDASNRSLQERIYALQDEANATKAANAANQAYGQLQTDIANHVVQDRLDQARALFDAGKGISDFIKQLTTGRAGTASPEQLLAATRTNYLADLSGARNGNVDASGRITGSAQAYIDAQKGYTASGGATQAVISQVISELNGLPSVQSYQDQSLQLARQQLAAMLQLGTLLGSTALPAGAGAAVPRWSEPGWTDPISGAYHPPVPHYAAGTTAHPGGWAMVGERGPELAHLPAQTRVYTAQDTQRMMGGGASEAQLAKLIEVNERQAALIERLLQLNADIGSRQLAKQDEIIRAGAVSDATRLRAVEATVR